jgi:16S rRNA C967 or C1407 C5-methylase (RsmB/RsmF family)
MTSNNDEKTILCKDLLDHYTNHNAADIESFLKSNMGHLHTSSRSRFIRLNPRYDTSETLLRLQEELKGVAPIRIPWLDDKLSFYSVPGDYSLRSSPLFTSGRIYGMDVSSGAAVQALLIDSIDKSSKDHAANHEFRVLDLCCAPGLKTCAIADLLEQCQKTTKLEIVGVDINAPRLHLCRKIIQKYHIDPDTSGKPMTDKCGLCISLFCADGTTFGTRASLEKDTESLIFDSVLAREESIIAGKRKRLNKSARSRERKRLKTLGKHIFHGTQLLQNTNGSSEHCSNFTNSTDNHDHEILITRFDRVLVDAECSTDGAVRHLQKKVGNSHLNETKDCQVTNTKLTDSKQLDELIDLQKRLIMSGFRLLKPGGIMVYSTCSLAREQNENVVKWLLDECENRCELLPVAFNHTRNDSEDEKHSMISPGFDGIGLRFHPSVSGETMIYGGGFYLAKLKKSVL